MMSTPPAGEIETALRLLVPADQQEAAVRLAQWLASSLSSSTGDGITLDKSALPSDLRPVFQSLAGRDLNTEHGVISFGQNNQYDNVKIGDVAGGNLIKVSFNFNITQSTVTPPKAEDRSAFRARPPTPLSPLIGRADDVSAIHRLLDANRCVTLTGVGGVGKTALAQTVALAIWQDDHCQPPRGVPFVSLDALSSGTALAEYVRARLLPDSPPPATDDRNLGRNEIVRALTRAISQEAQLVVLDNFESALDEAGKDEAGTFMRELLEGTDDRVHFLITSRRPLGMRQEKVFEVQPLVQTVAMQLFYERSGLEQTPTRDELISEICFRVDYLPLAVELAALAPRQAHRPLVEVLEGLRVTPLDDEAALALDYPPRQRGLIASFRYTFEQLSPAAQRLLCAFSIFRGGADRAAIKAIDGTEQWEQALSELTDWRLLLPTEVHDTYRYRALETTLAFARWALQYYGPALQIDNAQLAQRHAQHYVDVAARFDTTPMARWREIEVDWENIKSGANWAVTELELTELGSVYQLLQRLDTLATNQTKVALSGEYASQLCRYIFRHRVAEGRYWLAAGLIAHHRTGNKQLEALFCNELGLWFELRGEYDEALGWFEKSVAQEDGLGDKAGLARTYSNIGSIYHGRGMYDDAMAWYKKSVALAEERDDKAGLARTYNNMGEIYRTRGSYDEALAWYEKSVALQEKVGDKAVLAATYNNIGLIHYVRGAYDKSLAWFQRSVALQKKVGDKAGLATSYSNIGSIHSARGSYLEAVEWFEKSVALSEQVGDKAGPVATYNNIGQIYRAHGLYKEAMSWFGKCVALAKELRDPHGLARVSHNMGMAAMESGDLHGALVRFETSRDNYLSIGLTKEGANEEKMVEQVLMRMNKATGNSNEVPAK